MLVADRHRADLEQGRVHLSGSNHGGADAPVAFLQAHHLGKGVHGVLGSAVGRSSQVAGPTAGRRGDVDDEAVPATSHVGKHLCSHIESPGGVHGHDVVPALGLDPLHGPFDHVHPGVVDQDVDLPEAVDGLAHQFADPGAIG